VFIEIGKGVQIMKSRIVLIAALLGIAFTGTAGAVTKVTSLGSLGDGDFGAVSNVFFMPTTFQDTVNFTLTSTSTISGLIAPARLLNASWSLSSSSGAIAGGQLNFGTYTFADLVPGNYSMSIFGSARALSGYIATYRVAVAAVPELETWLMLIIGLALAAYQLHRKQKMLGLQGLRDESATPA
jgi:hypothetical protein